MTRTASLAAAEASVDRLSPFSLRVKSAFEESSLSLTELAHECGVTPQAISNIVNTPKGRNVEGCRFGNKLARALGVSLDWLLYGEGERRPLDASAPPALTGETLLVGLTPFQAGALHSLAQLMRQGALPDGALASILHRAHDGVKS